MSEQTRPHAFTRRMLIGTGIALSAIIMLSFVYHVASLLLVVFAGTVLAVFLHGLARETSRWTGIPRAASLGLVIVVLAGLAAAGAWFSGGALTGQFGELVSRIPEAIDRIRSWFATTGWVQELAPKDADSGSWLPSGSQIVGQAGMILSGSMTVLSQTAVVLIVGLYLAAAPGRYTNAAAYLLPDTARPRFRELIQALGTALRWWLVGRIASMVVVGVLTTISLLIVGMPLATTLGVIAGLLSFVPYLGPFAAMVPAVLVALTVTPAMVAYVVVIFIGVQLLESNLITPLIQDRAVQIPPALLVTAQILMGVLSGVLGVLVATPLTVMLVVTIQMLYVETLLGDEVSVMGQ